MPRATRSEAQRHFIGGCEPGSIGASMNQAELKAFRQWLKETDRDRHYMERQDRLNGNAVVSNSPW